MPKKSFFSSIFSSPLKLKCWSLLALRHIEMLHYRLYSRYRYHPKILNGRRQRHISPELKYYPGLSILHTYEGP